MALRCFVKCPYGAHWWGICWEAQEVIWHQCEQFPIRVPNHHQLGLYKAATFAGNPHQVNDIPYACLIGVNLEFGHLTEDDMLPMSHCQVMPPLCPLPSGGGSGWQSTGASLWIYRHGNYGTRSGCWWSSGQPSFHTNFSSAPARPKHLWGDPFGPSSTKHGLGEVWSSEAPPWTCLAPTCLRVMQMTVAWVRPMQPTIAVCHMPSQANANTSSLILIRYGRGIIRTISEYWEQICIFYSNLTQCDGR